MRRVAGVDSRENEVRGRPGEENGVELKDGRRRGTDRDFQNVRLTEPPSQVGREER